MRGDHAHVSVPPGDVAEPGHRAERIALLLGGRVPPSFRVVHRDTDVCTDRPESASASNRAQLAHDAPTMAPGRPPSAIAWSETNAAAAISIDRRDRLHRPRARHPQGRGRHRVGTARSCDTLHGRILGRGPCPQTRYAATVSPGTEGGMTHGGEAGMS